MIVNLLLTLACVHLGALFLVAGIGKALTPGSLRADLRNDELLPEAVTRIVAASLPFLELGVALALVGGIEPRYPAIVAAALLVVFGTYRLALFVRRRERFDAPCGCFGRISHTSSTGSLSSDLTATGLNTVVAVLIAIFGLRDFAYSETVSWSLLSLAVAVMATIITVRSRDRLHVGFARHVSEVSASTSSASASAS